MSDTQDVTPILPPNKLAFIIDGKVVDILHTDDRLAAIFLSEPLIIDGTLLEGAAAPEVNDFYDAATGTFTRSEHSPSSIVAAAADLAAAEAAKASGA